MLSKSVNISYIAQNCVEFVITEDYASSFLANCKYCNFQTLDNVDPTKPLDPGFPVQKLDSVKELFAKRVSHIIANTKSDIVKEFFSKYSEERNILQPDLATPQDPQ